MLGVWLAVAILLLVASLAWWMVRRLAAEKRRREKAEADLRQAHKLEALGTLAGGIAHDINNVLQPILTSAKVIDGALPRASPLHEDVQTIVSAVERARDMARRVLLFTRRAEVKRAPMHLGAVVSEALKMVRASIPASVEIMHEVAAGPDTIVADPVEVHQVLLNLCSNAAFAMRELGGKLTVAVEPSRRRAPDDSVKYMLLRVSDTGRGMSAATMDRVFEPFFTTKAAGEGTGLGLSIVRGILRSLGGEVAIASTLGEGTTVEVYFPAVEAAEVRPAVRVARLQPGGGERVLLVDDEDPIRRATARVLGELGYRVAAFGSPLEAFRALESEPETFALLVTDLTMPHMSGVELIARVRAVRPDLPVILTTGYLEPGEGASKLRNVRLLVKPYAIEELGAALREIFSGGEPEERRAPGP